MKKYNPNKPLISIHIPKCAGSSFTVILKSFFRKGFLPHYHDEKSDTPPVKHDLRSRLFFRLYRPYLCIHGHFNHKRGNGAEDYYPEVDQFITFLRDPFELHLSNYFYIKREIKYLGGGAYRSGAIIPLVRNVSSVEEYLKKSKKSFIKHFLPSNITFENYQEILSEKFLYIGITENFQHSIDTLAKILGFPSVKVNKRNVSEWNEPIPSGAREEFIANNALEMAIYTFALNNFGNEK